MSVKRAQHEIDSAEFARWMAFYQLEPWGREVEDRPMALVAQTIANINRKRGTQPFKLDDFMFRYESEEAQTWEEQANILKHITLAMGGTIH